MNQPLSDRAIVTIPKGDGFQTQGVETGAVCAGYKTKASKLESTAVLCIVTLRK